MNANWSLPALTSTYANFLAEMKSRDEDIAIWFEGTTSTNLPIGTKRWNNTGAKFEEWSGTVWGNLSTLYEIKVRDSDKLNGQTASYYSVSTHLHNAVTTTANGFMSYADKVKLNGIATGANNYAHPTGDGNLHVPANGTANNGKFLQATSVAGAYTWASIPASTLSTLGITATATELNFMDGVTSSVQTQLNTKAPLVSPAFTGTPAAPTATAGTNTTQIATTAFVLANSDTVTSANVGIANAGLATGSIGSYAFLMSNTYNDSFSAGTTYAGSGLYYTGINNETVTGSFPYTGGIGGVVSGTWKAMGTCLARGDRKPSTLFLRIA